jgi:GNAT superfamily N-acetyltransferase
MTFAAGVSYRTGLPADALCVSALATQVFLDTYATEGIRPSLVREVHEQLSIGKVEDLLAAPVSTFILAEHSGHLIAFVQLTCDTAHDLVPGPAVEIDRLYVLERFTSKGVGKGLLRKAEEFAASRGAAAVWLTAWVGNPRALAFYARQGYRDVGASVYSFEGEDYENRVFAKRFEG